MESTFHIFKVTPVGPLPQSCTMKCPHCGNSASKTKPEEQFKCERCGWKVIQDLKRQNALWRRRP